MFSENLKQNKPVDCKQFPNIRFIFSENDSLFDEDPMISTLFFFFTEWSRFLDALVMPNSDKVLFFFFTEWSRFIDAFVMPNSDKIWSDIIILWGWESSYFVVCS